MKAQIEGLYPGDPVIVDEQGRRISLIVRMMPETPREVAELKKFCRMTDAFQFVIDEDFRENTAHIAPVYAERSFSVAQPAKYIEENMDSVKY